MASSDSGIRWDSDSLARRLAEFPVQADRALSAIVVRHSPILEAYMRHNAPWTDRTGNARNGLFAKPVREKGKRYAIVLAHTVDYGFWLEVKNSGQYAIVVPTIRTQSDAVMQAAGELFAVIFGGGTPRVRPPSGAPSPDRRVNYTTRDGRTIRVTQRQADNYGRNRR